jgi:arginyl-tRNA synthetase
MENLFATISTPIAAAFPDVDPGELVYEVPPNLALGDVALRTFELARKLKMAPPRIASSIAESVAFGPEVTSVSAAGPYVNFKLDRSRFAREIVAAALTGGKAFGSSNDGQGRKALVEHTSINPNASPHVGRARNAMLGDGIVRLLRFQGYEVEVHYYVNDMGRQIGLLVLVIEERMGSLLEPGAVDIPFDDVLQVYVEANARAKEDPAFAEKGYELLARMEQGDAEVQAKFRAVTDLCLKGQLAVLARLGASYDVFDHESDYVKDARLDEIVAALRERDAVFTDEDERLVVDLSKIGHKPEEGRYFVLLRGNGSSMYGYRDLAYTIDKMERGADLNLIVLGEDHKLYAEQVALILAAAGKPTPEPIHYSYILLKEGKMSTRQGKVVLLSEFLDEASTRASEKVAEQCQDLPEEEREAIAAKVAVSAIRFAILRVGANKNVVFDWDASMSFTGDTGPYVQYSCARISSILRKFGEVPGEVGATFPIETDAEWALLTKLASFPQVVGNATGQRNCAPIAQFALDTARVFTTFYHECPVLDAPTEAHRVARAQVCAATRQAIENALDLLGIEALERM